MFKHIKPFEITPSRQTKGLLLTAVGLYLMKAFLDPYIGQVRTLPSSVADGFIGTYIQWLSPSRIQRLGESPSSSSNVSKVD